MSRENRVGIFLCNCKNTISETINFKEIIEYFKKSKEVEFIEENVYLCHPESLVSLKKKIRENNLSRVIIAACSPQIKGATFNKTLEEAGLNFNLNLFVNLREQCTMVYKDGEGSTRSAINSIGGALRRIKLQQPIDSRTVRIGQNVLVIGGGLAGLQTAINLSKLSYSVVLVERESYLGGYLSTRPVLESSQANFNIKEFISEIIAEAITNQKIKVFNQAELIKLEGSVGNFQATIEIKNKVREKERIEFNIGAVALATGCQSYFPSDKYGIDLSSQVISLSQLEDLMSSKKEIFSNINNICFISGMVDDDQRLKGDTLLRVALMLVENYKIQVYIICKNVYVAEEGLEELYQKARSKGIIFLKYDEKKPEMNFQGNNLNNINKIEVSLYDLLLGKDFYDKGKKLIISCDLVVLEEQIIPATGSEKLSEILQVGSDEDGFYQQKNISLQPVFTNRKGIFTVGSCRGLRNISQTLDDSAMASLEIHSLLKEKLVRYNLDKAIVDNDKCTLCLTCLRTCPHKAIQLERNIDPDQVKIKINDLACESCGICVSHCPANAITLPRYKNNQIMAEIG
ncbi:MAG: FAD-dependent oxidoreductase [Caldisericia bacterium]|nr:FAD-dependent oxidoreductase [Caldisericia bacterium]MDD5688950.1 FAD-dependent oxidoreductase [Caldisericia bacterium]